MKLLNYLFFNNKTIFVFIKILFQINKIKLILIMKMKSNLKLNLQKILNIESNFEVSKNSKSASKKFPKNLIKILPNLYISNYEGVSNKKILEKKKISIIFNLTLKNCKNLFKENFTYETFNLEDDGNINIKNIIKKIIKKVHFYIKKNKKVVIHCYKGISRAPTLAIAYLMKIYNKNYDEAFDYVRGKSFKIDPNAGFLVQLMNC